MTDPKKETNKNVVPNALSLKPNIEYTNVLEIWLNSNWVIPRAGINVMKSSNKLNSKRKTAVYCTKPQQLSLSFRKHRGPRVVRGGITVSHVRTLYFDSWYFFAILHYLIYLTRDPPPHNHFTFNTSLISQWYRVV